jgi:hypothetical protein
MIATKITTKSDLLLYVNQNPFEATIEIADVELEAVCTIKDIDFPYGEVKSIEVDLVSLCGAPAEYFVTGIIRLAEEKLSRHEDVLNDVRTTVQYVLDMQEGHRGDWTGGDAMDRKYEEKRDREVCNG